MNDKVSGIILSINDYKDNDQILKVYTKEYGLLSFIGKGSRKITTKKHYLPFNEYEFIINYKEDKTMFNLINSKLLTNNYLSDNLEMISYFNIFCELLSHFNNEYNLYPELLLLFSKVNDKNKYCLGCLFINKLLTVNGYKPYNKGCVVCDDKHVISFSTSKGGFVCKKHIGNDLVLEKDNLKLILYVTSLDIFDYEKLNEYTYNLTVFNTFIEFIKYNLNIKLKSYDFYVKVSK